jgi:glucose uptake protein GlcU
MCFFISLLPATFWAVIGYFVLFASTRAEGRVQTLGRWLATWVFFIAVLIPFVAAYITLAGFCPIGTLMQAHEWVQ